jgi:phosphatidylserine/phosphatidylglycerophosphate/cardiolipin synthase-like enzyme
MNMTMMNWALVVMGFTGALTLRFLWQTLVGMFVAPPSAAVHFSPKGGCTEAIVAELRKARREVLVLAYSFTGRPITEALIEAQRRGVRVEIILDHSNEKEPHTDLPFLLEKGLKPLIDDRHAIAHNKVMVIDQRTIVTGSFNFTHQAELENAENMLIIKGHPDLVQQYRQNIEAHKAHARPVGSVVATSQPQRPEGQHRRAA